MNRVAVIGLAAASVVGVLVGIGALPSGPPTAPTRTAVTTDHAEGPTPHTDTFSGAWRNATATRHWNLGAFDPTDRVGDGVVRFRNHTTYADFQATVTFSWETPVVDSEWNFTLRDWADCPPDAPKETLCYNYRLRVQGTSPVVVTFDLSDMDEGPPDEVRPVLNPPKDWPVEGHGTNVDDEVRWSAVVEYT